MRSRIGKKGTALAVVALAATAVAGGALAAIAAHSTAMTTTTTIKATETNYKITLSRATAPVGTVVFVVHNSSKTAHRFGVKGVNGFSRGIPTLIKPGQTKYLTVVLKKGTYTVFCKIHASLGMKTILKVGTTTGTTTSHTTTTSTWG
ncbi:MAG TPA: cupredoxin domain-containing protein [Gaiellaceae bacterium]|nr:cupredoxin domain-containing protein [Gaiellaceae bacterium]